MEDLGCSYDYSPVLVEATLAFLAQMLTEDGLERTQTTWCFDVAHKTNARHRWRLNDRDRLDNFLLVSF